MNRVVLFSGVAVFAVAIAWIAAQRFRAEPPSEAGEEGSLAGVRAEPQSPRDIGAFEVATSGSKRGALIARTSSTEVERKPPGDAARSRDETTTDEDGAALVGLELAEATETELQDLKVPAGMTGVVVRSVHPASPAREAALQKHDVIVRADRSKITSRDSLKAAVGGRAQTLLTVYRDGYPFQVVLHKPFKGGGER